MADEHPEDSRDDDGKQPGRPAAVEARADVVRQRGEWGQRDVARLEGLAHQHEKRAVGFGEQRQNQDRQTRQHQPPQQTGRGAPAETSQHRCHAQQSQRLERNRDAKQERRPSRARRSETFHGQRRPEHERHGDAVFGVPPEADHVRDAERAHQGERQPVPLAESPRARHRVDGEQDRRSQQEGHRADDEPQAERLTADVEMGGQADAVVPGPAPVPARIRAPAAMSARRG